ncbi:hypothetical protein [Kangiella shandongensis]|uniref:hypothetical protein n=1 Tax=Kangiella shandongensis TaxID=2763258 RepID=UPI001CBBC02F|nr:hypothetical protein [Kangiella shandongensis]
MTLLNRLQTINKKLALSVIWSIVVLSWLITGGILLFGVSKNALIILVTIAAVLTETGFWLTALLLGVAIVNARRAVLTKVKALITGRVFSADK